MNSLQFFFGLLVMMGLELADPRSLADTIPSSVRRIEVEKLLKNQNSQKVCKDKQGNQYPCPN